MSARMSREPRRRVEGPATITNERQYRITRGWLKKFEASIAAHDAAEPSPDVHPRIYRAMGDALGSEAEVLRGQLQEYDRLRTGRVK